jgi:hypothetical protein
MNGSTNPYKPPETPVVDPPAQNERLRPTTCTHCGHGFNGAVRKTFLGFQKFTCERCRKDFSTTLFPGYRITYWVLLVLSTLVMLITPGTGPNIFFILMGIAVSIDIFRLLGRPRQ